MAQLLVDPYTAVRYLAHRSLRSQPGYGAFAYDHLAPQAEREEAAVRAYADWFDARVRSGGAGNGNATLLLAPDGGMVSDEFQRLLRLRNDQSVVLLE